MESFEVIHLLFEGWTEKSVPNEDGQDALLEFMQIMEDTNIRPNTWGEPPLDPPILVHCSSGGRMGTFLATCSLLRAHKCLQSPYDNAHAPPRIPTSSDVQGLAPEIRADPVMYEIDLLRFQRAGLVDNEAQARFVYQMLWLAITARDQPMTKPRPNTSPNPMASSSLLPRSSSRVSRNSNRKGETTLGTIWSSMMRR